MPFKSKAQARYMYANKPSGVNLKEWSSKTDWKNLPEKKKKKSKGNRASKHVMGY